MIKVVMFDGSCRFCSVIEFTWDGTDVSVHRAEWLAQALRWLEDGNEYNESWEG